MVSSLAPTVAQYLASLPPDRRKAISAVRKVIKANLPGGFKEGMQYGAIEVIGEAIARVGADEWIAIHQAAHSPAAKATRRAKRA